MTDFPPTRPFDFASGDALSTSASLLGLSTSVFASAAWPSANLAIFLPVRPTIQRTVYKLAIGAGSTAGGNFDIGLYDMYGNRLVSSGATAKGSTVEQVIDIADTVIGPGLFYLAMSADGTNNYIMQVPTGTSPVPLQKTRLYGVLEAATSYPLPATVTMGAAVQASIPAMSAYLRPY